MRVLFVDGTKGFSPTRTKEQAAGGIVTSLTKIPAFLASRGHSVYVKSVFDKTQMIDGVQHLSLKDESPDVDVVVFNRNVLNHSLVAQAKKLGAEMVWWLHDIVDHRYLIDDAFKEVQHIVSLSDYCTQTYSEYYEIPVDRFTTIINGVDDKVFFPTDSSKRVPGRFIFASAPIKGMKPLAYTIRNLRRHNPKAELHIYASQKLHDLHDDALVRYQMGMLAEEEGVKILPPVPQHELADALRQACGLLMPNSYPEICSNLLLQSIACKTPVIGSPTGSIPQFVSNGRDGYVTKSSPNDLYFWWAEFARLTVKVMKEGLPEEKFSRVPSWEIVGMAWERFLIEKVLQKRGK